MPQVKKALVPEPVTVIVPIVAQTAPTQATVVINKPVIASTVAPVYGDIEQMIITAANKYGLNPDEMLRIAKCESTLNPNAVNYNYYENGNPSGVYQHISGYYPARAARYGYSEDVFDAYSNINVTAAMFADGQSRLWQCK